MKDGAISINQVLYARHFHKKRIFSGSHILMEAAKSPEISRGVAGRIAHSIFSRDGAQEKKPKRLPKRLINVIPIIQKLITRFRYFDIEALAKNLLPIPSAFREFMRENHALKRIARKPAGKLSSGFKGMDAIASRALESEYLSQEDSEGAHDERKRKRRENAIESRSWASASSAGLHSAVEGTSRKRQRNSVEDSSSSSSEKVATNLSKLQEHRDEISRLGEFVVSKRVVYRLLRKFVAGIVPKEIWGPSSGSEKNWQRIKQLLQRFVNSRKYDVISLKEVSGGIFAVMSLSGVDG